MADQDALTKKFQMLSGEAAAGRLFIEDGAAQRCANACDAYISDLEDLGRRAQAMDFVNSFGSLNSAKELGKKFAGLALGDANSGSYVEAIRQHIEILQEMAEMYRKAGAAYVACDEATRLAISQQTNQLN